MAGKEAELARAKRQATLVLLAAGAVFLLTLFGPDRWWVLCIRMMSEAALVGGLADWFAVAALFRRIPARLTVPYLTAHTAVIPRSKDRIADSLAGFVKEKYLDPESMAALVRRNDVAQRTAQWLQSPQNTERVAQFALVLVRGMLNWVEAERFQHLLKQAMRTALEKADFSQVGGAFLDTLTRDGRHQVLLDQLMTRVLAAVADPATRSFIAERIVQWLREGGSWKRKVLPAEWMGEQGSRVIATALMDLIEEVRADQGHSLRAHFDREVQRFAGRLKDDPAFLARGEQLKEWLLADEALGDYANALWAQLSEWIRQDLAREDSVIFGNAKRAAAWLGRQLAEDSALRQMINERLEHAARQAGADSANFLADHIRDTTRQWNAGELSRQVELHIGRELQAIRLNGTAMGAAIGFVLFLLTQLSK